MRRAYLPDNGRQKLSLDEADQVSGGESAEEMAQFSEVFIDFTKTFGYDVAFEYFVSCTGYKANDYKASAGATDEEKMNMVLTDYWRMKNSGDILLVN